MLRSLLRITLALTVLQCLPALASDSQQSDALQRLKQADTDISQELKQVEKDVEQDRQRLRHAERALTGAAITPQLLEDARLEQASLNSRFSGLNTRLVARTNTLEQLDREIETLESRMLQRDGDQEARNQTQMLLADLVERRETLAGLTAKLSSLQKRYEIRKAIARQRLNLLQARFELPDLSAATQFQNQAVQELQAKVDALLAEASAARRETATLGRDLPRDQARRRLLELQALVAEEQAEFHQMGITRLRADRALQSLSVFSDASAAPVRVLKSALQNIEKMLLELDHQKTLVNQKRDQFLEQQKIVRQQGAIAQGADRTFEARLNLIGDLSATAEAELAAIAELINRMQASQDEYKSTLAANAGAELLIRSELPVDAESWKQLGQNLATLPVRVLVAYQQALVHVGHAWLQSTTAAQIFCLLLLLGLIILAWKGRNFLTRKLQQVSETDQSVPSAVSVPLAIIRRNLITLAPPVYMFALSLVLDIQRTDLVLLLTPLLAWPAIRFALDFVNNLLDEYTPELDRSRTQLLLTETRWVVILAAVLAAVLVIANAVALSPAVIDAIDRLSMLCLLLISLPMLHLRKLLIAGVEGKVSSRLLLGVTLVIPLVLGSCALIGVAGYINLSWAISVRLGWLLLLGLGIHLARYLLVALLQSAERWAERRDAETAQAWQQYILRPLYRVTLLLLVLVAAQWLFQLYEWNDQTPIVSSIPLLLDSTLFNIGDTEIKLKTLGVAVLVLFVAFWGAGWSKEVSYMWLYTGVQDKGIRSSLSTFTQYLVVVLGLVAAMKIIGLDLTALTVFAGALGVGIGFGMQTIVVNFISGILLLIERPLATTDLVNVDAYEGEVTRIGIRSLTVKTFDNQEVIIPNSSVITKPFINWTRSDDIMRTLLMVGISYDDDPHQAVALIKEQVVKHEAVLSDPGPKVLLWEYGDSALMLRVQFHTRLRGPVGRGDVRSQILFAIWDAFKEAGITIPYPQRDVHLHKSD